MVTSALCWSVVVIRYIFGLKNMILHATNINIDITSCLLIMQHVIWWNLQAKYISATSLLGDYHELEESVIGSVSYALG